jgi:adenosylmethionine-8-amino-7-oxononanoate aminotransferase
MADRYAAHAPTLAAIPGVSDVRWLGSVLALNVGAEGYHAPIGRRIQAEAADRGLYLRPLGDVVYLMPPAALSPDDLDRALHALAAALAAALRPPVDADPLDRIV